MTGEKQIILDFLNTYLPILTLIGFILILVVYSILFLNKKSKILNTIKNFVLPLGFFATLFATIISLIYSDYLGVAPCGLCWIQRIFIYSQVILFTVAYIKNDLAIFKYSFWLSFIGAIFAVYHEYLQLGFSEVVPCPTTGGIVDCAKPLFIEFGFVTFPFMSFVLFLFLILLANLVKNKY